jgi:hypothetical protein
MADINSQPDGSPFVESDGVNYRGIVVFVAILAITTFICQGIVVVMFKYFDKTAVAASPARATMSAPAGTLPPPPNLLTNEPLNLKNFRDHEADVLGNYAWQDQNAGVVRIPIDDAIRLTLQRGLPARQEPK